MAQQQQERDDSDRRVKGVRIDAPGFEGEVSEDTAKSFLQYTGRSWNWVVISVAVSIFFLALCLGLSWLI
jgi:hypothetical protein